MYEGANAQALEWHPQREVLLEYLARLEWLLQQLRRAVKARNPAVGYMPPASKLQRASATTLRDAAVIRYASQASRGVVRHAGMKR